jgi:hypothetical protein
MILPSPSPELLWEGRLGLAKRAMFVSKVGVNGQSLSAEKVQGPISF